MNDRRTWGKQDGEIGFIKSKSNQRYEQQIPIGNSSSVKIIGLLHKQ